MICFTWWGLTQYAARAIEAFNKVSSESVCVVATWPRSSPVEGMEQILSCPLIWVEETETGYLTKLPEMPRVVFISNWNLPCWRVLEQAVKGEGGQAVAMIDTNCIQMRLTGCGLKLWLWQLARAIRFRLSIRKRFDAFFVAGESGAGLMRLYGVPRSKVFKGLYGADPSLFTNGAPLSKRPKSVIYVGQFIERKNVRRLVQAFLVISPHYSDWSLELYGAGLLADELAQMIKKSGNRKIHLHSFCQPEHLSEKYQAARIFVLPSIEEHWGVVVHEAALSGCSLALSEGVGAAEDFATDANARCFNPQSVKSIVHAMEDLMRLNDVALEQAQETSVQLAGNFGLDRFVQSVQGIVC